LCRTNLHCLTIRASTVYDKRAIGRDCSIKGSRDHADGKRFLINTTGTDAASAPPLTVVTNWQAGLSRAR